MRARRAALLVAASLALTACGGDDRPATFKLYDRAPVPGVPDRTAAIGPEASALAPDGQYWADLIGGRDTDTPTFDFLLTQAFFAASCVEELGVEGCPNDFGTLDEPNVTVTVQVADVGSATVVSDDRRNFAVTPQELFTLAGGEPPSKGSPDGYAYAPFPFLLTVRGGEIVTASQIWLP